MRKARINLLQGKGFERECLDNVLPSRVPPQNVATHQYGFHFKNSHAFSLAQKYVIEC